MLHLEQFVTFFGEKLILVLLISVKFDRGQRLINRTRITRQICIWFFVEKRRSPIWAQICQLWSQARLQRLHCKTSFVIFGRFCKVNQLTILFYILKFER